MKTLVYLLVSLLSSTANESADDLNQKCSVSEIENSSLIHCYYNIRINPEPAFNCEAEICA